MSASLKFDPFVGVGGAPIQISKMSYLSEVLSLKNIIACGVKPGTWTEYNQSQLTESMILACKENPDWTFDQANKKCTMFIEEILFENFKKIYKYSINKTNYWTSIRDAYEDYIEMGEVEFEKEMENQIVYKEFCDEFYEELRSRYNACSATVYDEFKKMKKNNWSFAEYRQALDSRKKSKI